MGAIVHSENLELCTKNDQTYRDFVLESTGTAPMTLIQKVSLIKRRFPLKSLQSGVWKQYDGGVISWTPWWAADDPNGGKAVNCGKVYLSEDANAGQWADGICSRANYYICERGF